MLQTVPTVYAGKLSVLLNFPLGRGISSNACLHTDPFQDVHESVHGSNFACINKTKSTVVRLEIIWIIKQ